MTFAPPGNAAPMPTFIDESGDAGPLQHSSQAFRLAAVWLKSNEDVQSVGELVSSLRIRLGVSSEFEFHHASITVERKRAFFEALGGVNFRFAVSSFDKNSFDRRQLTKEHIHQSTVGELVDLMRNFYLSDDQSKGGRIAAHERIIYDESSDPNYSAALINGFRSINFTDPDAKRLIGKISSNKSHRDPCLQLADMVCGVVGRHLNSDNEFYGMIERKRIGVTIIIA